MNWRKLKQIKYLKTIVCLILTILIARVFLQPFLSKWNDVNNKIKINEAKFYKALRLISEKDSINSGYRNITEKVDLSSLGLGDEEALKLSFYKFLNSMAESYNISLKSISPKPAGINETGESCLYFDIDGEAQVIDFLKFLYQIEHPLNLVSVEEVKLNPGQMGLLLFKLRLKRTLI